MWRSHLILNQRKKKKKRLIQGGIYSVYACPPLFLYPPSKRDSSCSPCLHDVGLSSHALRTNFSFYVPLLFSYFLSHSHSYSHTLIPSYALSYKNHTHRNLGRTTGQVIREKGTAFASSPPKKNTALVGRKSSSLT